MVVILLLVFEYGLGNLGDNGMSRHVHQLSGMLLEIVCDKEVIMPKGRI